VITLILSWSLPGAWVFVVVVGCGSWVWFLTEWLREKRSQAPASQDGPATERALSLSPGRDTPRPDRHS